MAGQNNRGFVAVHVGAGYHSPANSDMYKEVCQQASLAAVLLLRQRKTALEAILAAMTILEDSACTNAGTGSNLTVDGCVECDASIMEGSSLQYGSVGAISRVKNPILAAGDLLTTQKKGLLSLGRVPPSMLVGPGASSWASTAGIPMVSDGALVTDTTERAYRKHKRKLEVIEARMGNQKALKRDSSDTPHRNHDSNDDHIQDTVGAICVDAEGHVASAVSSGGIVLKQPGRVGQAALYGCGCWAENDDQTEATTGVAVSTSGCGEHLIKTLLAKECADCLKEQDDPTMALTRVMTNKFLGSPFLRDVDQKLGGALAVKCDCTQEHLEVEVFWMHTTDSMCLAYMSTEDKQPKALLSRLPDLSKSGKTVIIQSKCYTL